MSRLGQNRLNGREYQMQKLRFLLLDSGLALLMPVAG
jgi:hypothetical protein